MVFGVIVTAQYQHMMDNDGWCDLNISIQNLTLFHFLLYILSFYYSYDNITIDKLNIAKIEIKIRVIF